METSVVGETLNEDVVALEKLRWIDSLRPQTTKTGAETWSIAFSPDNSYFAYSCGHCIVVILPWDAVNNRPCDFDSHVLNTLCLPETCCRRDPRRPLIVECDSNVWSLAFSISSNYIHPVNDDGSPRRPFHNLHTPNNKLILAVGLNNGRIRVYSIYSGKFLMELMDHRDIVKDLRFSPIDSLILLSASVDSTLKLWNLNDDGNMFKTLNENQRLHNSSIMCCDWSPDGRFVAAGGNHKLLIVYESNDWTAVRTLVGHNHCVVSCEFSGDGSFLASSSYDTTVILWNYIAGDRLLTFWHLLPAPRLIFASGANEHYVRCLAFSPDAQHVATVCDDDYLRIWNIYKPEHPERMAEVRNPLCVRYSADGFNVCVGTKDGNVHLFASPMIVQTLAKLCRIVIRRKSPVNQIQSLPLPKNLKNFLMYR